MFVRSLQDGEATDHFVEWGSGTSHRLLTEKDAWALPSATCGPIRCHLSTTATTLKPPIASLERA